MDFYVVLISQWRGILFLRNKTDLSQQRDLALAKRLYWPPFPPKAARNRNSSPSLETSLLASKKKDAFLTKVPLIYPVSLQSLQTLL